MSSRAKGLYWNMLGFHRSQEISLVTCIHGNQGIKESRLLRCDVEAVAGKLHWYRKYPWLSSFQMRRFLIFKFILQPYFIHRQWARSVASNVNNKLTLKIPHSIIQQFGIWCNLVYATPLCHTVWTKSLTLPHRCILKMYNECKRSLI